MNMIWLLCCFWQIASGIAVPTVYGPILCTSPNIMAEPRIVIIGAGTSGIACATKLLEYGFEDVHVLEAEPRIGGRIHTIPFGENVIDLGAQWCEGEKDNVVYELASKYDLLESTDVDNYQFVRSNREVIPKRVESRLSDIVDNLDLAELRKYNGSLGSYLKNHYYATLNNPVYADIEQTIAKEYFEAIRKIKLSSEVADNLDEVSALAVGEYRECEGDYMLNWKDKGYKEFLRLLLKTHELGTEFGVLDKHLHLSKTVTKIKWNTDQSNVEITCKDGEVIQADHVIVTVSLGVLKAQHMHLFEPQLPVEKIRAIEGIAFGAVDKIFLEFSVPFWPTNFTGFSLLWIEEDLVKMRGTSFAWLEGIYGFYTIKYQPKLLEGWIVGPHARYMETLPTDEVLAGCMFLLRKFLTWDIPDAINIKTTAWSTNANFRGTWSFRSIHTDEVGTSARRLAEPLTAKSDSCDKPIVQFAGEATNEKRYGNVHGATETGWREALVLAKLYARVNDSVLSVV